MTLNAPFMISSRLLPAVRVGKSTVSIQFSGETSDGRVRYEYFIDAPDFEYSSSDLKSGVGGGSIQSGMESLLSFLGAAAESYAYHKPPMPAAKLVSTKITFTDGGENYNLFPVNVVEWAYHNSDGLGMLQLELNENKDLITD